MYDAKQTPFFVTFPEKAGKERAAVDMYRQSRYNNIGQFVTILS